MRRSLRSRCLEVADERENGRARGRHARGESPSRAPVFSCAHYAGYVRRENYSKTRMFVIKDSPVCLALDNFSEKGANENGNYDT